MKVAVAFFGQPRYVGNPQIINTYKQVLLDKYDCDVFGHMWWQEDGGEFDYSSWSKTVSYTHLTLPTTPYV